MQSGCSVVVSEGITAIAFGSVYGQVVSGMVLLPYLGRNPFKYRQRLGVLPWASWQDCKASGLCSRETEVSLSVGAQQCE